MNIPDVVMSREFTDAVRGALDVKNSYIPEGMNLGDWKASGELHGTVTPFGANILSDYFKSPPSHTDAKPNVCPDCGQIPLMFLGTGQSGCSYCIAMAIVLQKHATEPGAVAIESETDGLQSKPTGSFKHTGACTVCGKFSPIYTKIDGAIVCGTCLGMSML